MQKFNLTATKSSPLVSAQQFVSRHRLPGPDPEMKTLSMLVRFTLKYKGRKRAFKLKKVKHESVIKFVE